jgi:hypothetical protein
VNSYFMSHADCTCGAPWLIKVPSINEPQSMKAFEFPKVAAATDGVPWTPEGSPIDSSSRQRVKVDGDGVRRTPEGSLIDSSS